MQIVVSNHHVIPFAPIVVFDGGNVLMKSFTVLITNIAKMRGKEVPKECIVRLIL